MMLVSYHRHLNKESELKQIYHVLGDRSLEKNTLVLFESRDRLKGGLWEWDIDLPAPIPPRSIHVFLRNKAGVTKNGNSYATITCSPEGNMTVGQRWGLGNCLYYMEGTSVRLYNFREGLKCTVKEYLVRSCDENKVVLQVKITRDTPDEIRRKFPHYKGAISQALADLKLVLAQ